MISKTKHKAFQFTPEIVQFSEYEPNQTYEVTVTAKNVSPLGRRAIFLPLANSVHNKKAVFSIINVKVFVF